MNMSNEATREYTAGMRVRYRAMMTKRAKGKVLDEFCETTKLERKHAIKVLRSRLAPLRTTGRKSVYGGATGVLKKLWLLFDQPCSKLLHPVMASYVASYEKHAEVLDVTAKDLLLRMSPSTMDRLLRAHRVRTSLWRGHGGPMALMKRQVPVRTERWEGRGPGWFEADTVAHCGGSMEGCFAYTLTFTDTDSQWTELRAIWNRGGYATTQRVQEIEQMLPFLVKGVNTDNGPEFLNGHLIRHFKARDVVVPQSRSRPYQKNDNARVEQKNGSHVRPLLGYDRFEDPDCIEDLNELLALHSCWANLFRPCMKLVAKEKDGHRYKKTYDRPLTPAQRVLAHPGLPVEVTARIMAMLQQHDCYTLKCQVQEKTQQFFTRFVRDSAVAPRPGPGAGPGPSALRAAPSGTGPGPAPGPHRRSHHRPSKRTPICQPTARVRQLTSVSSL
jgi:transposase InsO family protein